MLPAVVVVVVDVEGDVTAGILVLVVEGRGGVVLDVCVGGVCEGDVAGDDCAVGLAEGVPPPGVTISLGVVWVVVV